jgi:hypothetical protein
MTRCALCHGKLGLGVRYRKLWNGRWWVHTRFCSAHCVERYNANTKLHWFTFLYAVRKVEIRSNGLGFARSQLPRWRVVSLESLKAWWNQQERTGATVPSAFQAGRIFD